MPTNSPLVNNLSSIISMFLWMTALIVTILVVRRSSRNYVGGTRIILKKFLISETTSQGIAIEIVGRRSGIASWFLNLFKLEQDCSLAVSDSEVTITQASLSGFNRHSMPLSHISATVCGYQRSVMALAIAAFFAVGFLVNFFSSSGEDSRNTAVGGLLMSFLLLATSSTALIVFFLSRRIGFSIETAKTRGLAFKPSVIEGVSVDLKLSMAAMAILDKKIRAAQAGHQAAVIPSALSATEASICAKCAASNPAGSRFCENCGAPLLVARPAGVGGR